MARILVQTFPQEDQNVWTVGAVPGQRNMPPERAKPIAYFYAMFTLNLMKRFVVETNRYASQFIRGHLRQLGRSSRVHLWMKEGHLTLREFKAFIAVILNMGLNKKPTIEQSWREGSKSHDAPWFRRLFTRNRFQLILKFLHVVDNRKTPSKGQPGYNPAAKFQPVTDHFNMRSQHTYIPNQKLTVDESLIATKGRSVMMQYIPSKHSKFGIKLWMLVEAVTGFVIRIKTYRGKQYDPVQPGHQQGVDVVYRLLSESSLLNKYYHVYCNSFFASINLARRLLNFRTYITCTLRSTRPMPQVIKRANLKNDQSVFMRNGTLLTLAYKEGNKKPVRLISSYHSAKISNNKPKPII